MQVSQPKANYLPANKHMNLQTCGFNTITRPIDKNKYNNNNNNNNNNKFNSLLFMCWKNNHMANYRDSTEI
jgi:hypothetical protein